VTPKIVIIWKRPEIDFATFTNTWTTSSTGAFFTVDTGTTDVTILGNGNVGIGDSDPVQLLTVGSSDAFTVDNEGMVDVITNGFTTTALGDKIIDASGDVTKTGVNQSFIGLNFNSIINIDGNPNIFGGDMLSHWRPTYLIDSAVDNTSLQNTSTLAFPNIKVDGADIGARTHSFQYGYVSDGMTEDTGSGTTALTVGSWRHFAADSLNVGAGTTLTEHIGFVFTQAGGAGTKTTQYGMFIGNVSTGTNDYGIWLQGADDGAIVLDDDADGEIILGEGQDATIVYDGTDLVIDPDIVGTGEVQINGGLDIAGTFSQEMVTIAADDTTPDVSGGSIFTTSANTVSTEITDLDNPQAGQIIYIIGGSDTNSTTINDSGNFNLSTTFTASQDDTLTLFVQADNDYIEIGRSDN